MTETFITDLAALLSLMPAAFIVLKRAGAGRDRLYWLLLAVAALGPTSLVAERSDGAWLTGFSATLWVSVSVSLILFAGLAALHAQAWRLTPLIVTYTAIMAGFALVFERPDERPLDSTVPAVWLDTHILISVITYGLLTLAAVAAFGGFLQERALKTKRPNHLTRLLPPVSESERLSTRLLVASEVVLGLGLMTGMAVEYFAIGRLLRFDHKVLFSLLAFLVIGIILAAHHFAGVRGKAATRLVLSAYLLLTLGYPGVKFVTDVLIH